jgi:hypothetical protein
MQQVQVTEQTVSKVGLPHFQRECEQVFVLGRVLPELLAWLLA